jgi:5-deoxy-glucuronate isomerase
MNRLIKAPWGGKFVQLVPTGTLRFLDFARLQLKQGEQHALETGGREYVLDVFSGVGRVMVETADGERTTFEKVGGRADVFSGPPEMVYVPPNARVEVTAGSGLLDTGIFSAPSQASAPPSHRSGAGIVANEVGRENWRRKVYCALAEDVPAERLLAGETLNPPGNWSSYPPHKHDKKNPPHEAVLEEIYFFRVKPSQGFGFIWTYTPSEEPDGFSNVFVVEDGDTVLLPKGYHPVVAAPGYELHYTWVLAGEERRYGAWADDPRHAWIRKLQ